ncbi:hypothetical protein [Anaerovibrio sp.]|uniref:hypothetical protein n=1 Tax=Anaerovibrio sp. TaxID=1872532 RepID=UPI0038910BB3
MMTPQQLKNSILQRAIEGKLVEQRPEEGTAKELLKAIKAEKAQLIKDGKKNPNHCHLSARRKYPSMCRKAGNGYGLGMYVNHFVMEHQPNLLK